MSTDHQLRSADLMLTAGQSDEDTERLTGVSLLEIIGLRAGHAGHAAEAGSLATLDEFLRQGLSV